MMHKSVRNNLFSSYKTKQYKKIVHAYGGRLDGNTFTFICGWQYDAKDTAGKYAINNNLVTCNACKELVPIRDIIE